MPVEKDPATGRNTSPKFDIGRNFSNKIWQASTGLAIPNLEGYDPQPLAYASLPLEDRWILSRLQTAIQTIDKALSRLPVRRRVAGVLPLLLERTVRLVPGDGQAAPARRAAGQARRAAGAGVGAGPVAAAAAPVHAVPDRGVVEAAQRGRPAARHRAGVRAGQGPASAPPGRRSTLAGRAPASRRRWPGCRRSSARCATR